MREDDVNFVVVVVRCMMPVNYLVRLHSKLSEDTGDQK